MTNDIDVIVPARRGSVGLPGKNMRVLIDRPLALHSVACAHRITGIRTVLVTTDDPILAAEAREAGAYVPSLRPVHLANSTAPMADVVRHAMTLIDAAAEHRTGYVLLLDPTSPLRDPAMIDQAIAELRVAEDADGAVSISVPSFNPLWVGVQVGLDRTIRRHPSTPQVFTRRQDVPQYWRINGNFYVWRSAFARQLNVNWLDKGTFIGAETPEILSHSIDRLDDFRLVEALIASGVVSLPWLENARA